MEVPNRIYRYLFVFVVVVVVVGIRSYGIIVFEKLRDGGVFNLVTEARSLKI